MVFGKISDVFSSATKSTAAIPYMSPGLSPPDQTIDPGFSFKPSGQASSLRHAASLQDFSAYRRLDPEEGNLGLGIDRKAHPLLSENAGSSFSKEKSLPGGAPFLKRKWVRMIMLALCFLLIGFLTYLIATSVYSYWFQGASKFYVVLDCGSTGTRVYVYRASISHRDDGSLSFDLKSFTEGVSRKSSGRAYDRMETEPGLHMLVRNTSGLKAAINPLVHWAKKQIPQHAHKTTSLFLYATAGVRRLPDADSKWLLDKAWSILNESPFQCAREWVKIITGMEEAYYGWIALNYQKGVLGTSPKRATFGALDMGGSSLQVTFESEKQLHNESTLNLKIGGVNHLLNAYSLAGYGLNDAFDKSVASIVKKLPSEDLVSGKIVVRHPCLQSGYKEQYTCSHCAANQQGSVSPVIGGRNLGKGVKPGIGVQLIGAPSWDACRALAKIAVNLSEWSNQSAGSDCDLQPCALPDSLPRPYGHFYAISGFFVVYRFFNLTPEAALDDVLEKGRDFCEKTWDIAKNSVPPQPFIEQYCFRAPYIVLLLREGLHITDTKVTIGSGSITWTLGVALLESGKAFSTRSRLPSYEILQMKIHPLILVALLFTSLVLLVCALSCVGNWMPKFSRRPYLPLFRHNSASAASVLNSVSPFRFQRWSPMNTGDGRVKMPLSPTIAGSQQKPFGLGHGLGGSSIQLMESSLYPSTSSVSHSYSSNSLGQMVESSSMASFWSPHRSQMRLQSRRSQSREDLSSSLAETHMVKV
ncbi:putative apyrase 7 [Turnera subulata]|uniref:Apyrase 7 n=1 Tax=Turnera subulata TaxID=218843 RepID=A0A9Q0GIJ5_9ROSI|nr:putative apyrase 7 [Turnera subulata]